jgi:hypothetical protein
MGARRIPTTVVLIAVLIAPLACTRAPTHPERTRTLATLERSLAWLDGAQPDPAQTAFGYQCLDAWTWHMFATWHPDETVRHRAAATTARRLAVIRPPSRWTGVALSYWSLALRIMAAGDGPPAAALATLADVDLTAALADSDATTRWWTLALLQQAGIPVAADPAGTFVATHAADGTTAPLTVTNVYQLYHEIVPAAGIALGPIQGFTAAQVAFAAGIAPALIDTATRSGDTDAVAEALVTAAILGGRETEDYWTGLRWLLDRHNGDGTFESNRDSGRTLDTDYYRHVVLVGSFALLTSLERYEPAGRR